MSKKTGFSDKMWQALYMRWQQLLQNAPSWPANVRQWLGEPANRRLLLRLSGYLAATAFTAFFTLAILVYWGAFGKLPTYSELRDIRNHNASVVLAEDGVILGKYYIQNRVNAGIDEIAPHIIHALIATEDARFLEHRGIDLRAWLRVLVKSILLMDDSAGGGSTLSQQLAKNLYPRRSYPVLSTLINKMRETFTARRLELTYSKEELLNLYLNTVPFGENIYGIKVAAQRFFNTSPKRLRPEQAALLIGMLKGNTIYNPVRHPDNALQRRNVVLSQMEKYGYLTPEASDSLRQLPLSIQYHKEGHNEGLATYFRELLRLEVEQILKKHFKPDGSPYNLYTDGLKIYTTIHSRMQRYAEAAVGEHMSKLQQEFFDNWKGQKKLPWEDARLVRSAMQRSDRYKALKAQGYSEAKITEIFNAPIRMRLFHWEKGEEERELSPLDSIKYYLAILNAGMLAAEPNTGLVRAWVGGIDHRYFQYDHVKSRRQTGSTFKPIVYAAALQSGMLPCEYIANEQITYPEYNNWQPRNADGEYGGAYSMEGALARSVNSVSVALVMQAGIESVRQLAKAMGIEHTIPREPSIALGTAEASLYEMVRAYATIANRGERPELHYLDRIETADGKILVQFERPNPRQFPAVMDSDNADMLIRMMQAVVNQGTGRRLRAEFGLNNDIAGKTGTTQNNSDGWFVGFTPKLVVGVWVGAETPKVHFRTTRAGQGGASALPIWGRFLRYTNADAALKDWRWGKFAPPSEELLALMQCPHFLEEMPTFVNDYEQSDTTSGFFQRLFHNLRKKDNEIDHEAMNSNLSRRKSDNVYESDESREQRKAFWSKKLFGNDQ